MELSDFVRATLQQIVEGVSSAQDAIAAKGATINPTEMEFYKDGHWSNYSHAMPQQVDFDVGLTSTARKDRPKESVSSLEASTLERRMT